MAENGHPKKSVRGHGKVLRWSRYFFMFRGVNLLDIYRIVLNFLNIREGFLFDPVKVEALPDMPDVYR